MEQRVGARETLAVVRRRRLPELGEHLRQPLECEAALLAAYTHLVYRSGVPLVDTAVIGGGLRWQAG